jgi:hypothetical protein
MKHRVLFVALAATLTLSACKKAADPTEAAEATANAPVTTQAPAAPAPATEPAAAATPKFDIASVPMSDKPLGAFPYFSLPQGYEPQNKPKSMDFTRYPFWTGDRMEWAEGKSYESGIVASDGKTYSQYELRKNLEALVTAAGGVKVTESRIPKDLLNGLDDEVKLGHNEGLGDPWNQPVQVYLIRRADRNIWVQYCATTSSAAWLILETAAFQPTAELKPQTGTAG